jgi:hypothetical protein
MEWRESPPPEGEGGGDPEDATTPKGGAAVLPRVHAGGAGW